MDRLQESSGQAQRAEIDRPHPGRPEQLRSDDDLGRAAADVADSDHALAGVRARDRAGECETTFLLGGDHLYLGACCTADRVEQALGRVALASGRGDDGLELADAELPCDPGVLAGHLPDLVELASPHASVSQNLLAEP